jgi:carbamoyltransferase
MIVSVTRPQQRVDLSQVGPILCDLRELNRYAAQRKTCNVSPRGVARFLADGKILGVARGRAENGAYSLGARSILCDAAAPNVGYLVRRAIKQVPDFIPFDAIVRRERVDDYFDDVPDEVWPTYPLQLKKQYGDRFCSVVHIDGAVRVFAVDEVQNPWLYELLRWFETYSGHGILLTTLFGAQNGGAVASIAAALAFLDTTLLDGIVVEDVLMWRKSEPNGRPLGFERL